MSATARGAVVTPGTLVLSLLFEIYESFLAGCMRRERETFVVADVAAATIVATSQLH